MAQKVKVLLIDDIDGGDADETVTFSLDGVSYEIDLTGANAKRLRDDMATWIGHARRAGGRRQTGRRSSGSSSGAGANGNREQLQKMREWGRANGFKVSDRGRVSQELQDAYHSANS